MKERWRWLHKAENGQHFDEIYIEYFGLIVRIAAEVKGCVTLQ